MAVTFRIRDDLTVNDIVHFARCHYVKATPHVGNWTPARLVLPTLGVSILCVDHTIGIRDRNAHPHLLIKDGVAHDLSNLSDRLTTHAHVTNCTHGGLYPIGTSLSEVHVGTLRRLYPEASIVTHSEHLRDNTEVILAVLEEVTTLSRGSTWWRKVDAEGVVTNYRSRDIPRQWSEIAPSIFPLTNEREGWLVHNRVSILMDVILQSRLGLEPEIYHLSGPDMVQYLGSEIEMISRMYDHVRKHLSLTQETITLNLVPFASFRFATRPSQAEACERLCKYLADGGVNAVILRDLLDGARDVLADSHTQSHLTQHDCVATGEHVVVPELVRDWSMATCARNLSMLQALI